MRTVKIKFLGDWAPEKREVEEFHCDDFIFLNLEGPILKENENYDNKKIIKAGPIMSHSNFIKCKSKGVSVLANNHLFDYGNFGYRKTVELLKKNNWYFVGAGNKKSNAEKPIIFSLNGLKIGVIARCEDQFGISQSQKPGVAGLKANIYNQILNLKKKTDIVIVSYHGAAEMSPWPSPHRQDLFRSFIDTGANIIYGHHSHVPQGWEEYNKGLIFYGLGNFCVDPERWSWHPNTLWSLAPEISFINKKIRFKLKTNIILDENKKLKILSSNNKQFKKHLLYLKICNKPLKNRKLLEGLWQEISLKFYESHFLYWLGFNDLVQTKFYNSLKKILRNSLNNLFFKKKKISIKKNKSLIHYHLFACNSHNDVISTALGLKCGEIKNLRNKVTKKLIDRWVIDK